MSESQTELDNCRACDEEAELHYTVEPGLPSGVSVVTYQHDRPNGTKAHVARRDGNCAICGFQVFDPDKIRQVLDQINQEAE